MANLMFKENRHLTPLGLWNWPTVYNMKKFIYSIAWRSARHQMLIWPMVFRDQGLTIPPLPHSTQAKGPQCGMQCEVV